ncbi:MAG: DUF1572 domain-containing protein [Saprospiraceae bacterium]|nr:DUF1572 domain-containing protein [Saprospiraceae bacterium]
MEVNHYLADRLEEVLINGKWISNTNFKEQLLTLSWTQAVQKIESCNTIADLTFHINYYIAGLISVLNGGALDIRDTYSFDAPPITSEQDWEDLVNKFYLDAEVFIEQVRNMTTEEIRSDFVDKKYGTYWKNIDAIIEHCYYHLGQIVLLRKRLH